MVLIESSPTLARFRSETQAVGNRRRGFSWLLAALVLGMAAGCQRDEIERYQVPRAKEPEPVQLLAAVIPQTESTWVFKLVGPQGAVLEQRGVFEELIRSVRFEKGAAKPILYMTPKGWRREPGAKFRYETLRQDGGKQPLEIPVFKFDGEAGSLRDNIDRWRRLDLGLPPISDEEMASVVRTLEVEGVKVSLVEMTGPGVRKSARGGMGDPMAGQPPMATPPAQPPAASSLKYTTPAGWREVDTRTSTLRLEAAFEATEEGRTARVTVLRSAGQGGGLKANVDRWRGNDLGLGPIQDDELRKITQKISVAGVDAQYVDLVGPEGRRQRVLGVVVPQGGWTWFFTMKGPADLVEKQKAAFESFLKSVRFE
jgi:hypothetical protein